MNCLEFRRLKLADPRRLPPDAGKHAAGCAACDAFAREVDETEAALDLALTAPVPEGLEDRIIFRSRHLRPAWRAWALAASVALGVGLGWIAWNAQSPSGQYARLAIEHVVLEPESLTTLRNAGPEAFQAVLRELGATLNESLGTVRYVRLCPVEDGFGWHVVFDTPHGLATLIFVPGKALRGRETASMSGWNALAQPTRSGYYAIVTASAAHTDRVDQWLRERVVWSRS
ncbi:MAG: hypothetical protein A3I63_03655 [Betaproteobacteria bacterium RIFCSPLOWO2_02_FULL_66_14]|nr:MAG: hypothetical protein A3I63_03655 [Betaproteobacteria bacterium RIFCSPLOWO2_02_FULL_66_14]